MKELTREEILNLPSGIDFVIYNPLTKQLKVETTSPIDIAHNKHCYSELKFYVKDDTTSIKNKLRKIYKMIDDNTTTATDDINVALGDKQLFDVMDALEELLNE